MKIMSSSSSDESQIVRGNDESVPQKEIVVSIILSESTASLLALSAPNLQDLIIDESDTSLFSFKALNFFKSNTPSKVSGYNLKKLFTGNKHKDAEYMNTDVLYIAKSFESKPSVEDFDDFPTRDHPNECTTSEGYVEQPLLMDKYKVYTRPLLTAKVTAHENKLKCECNNIYVSILESELTITNSGWMNFCRICHGGESVANLITPCRCRGSIALAHLQCLEEWLRQSANSRCELCQHHYEVIRQPKYSIPWSILVFLTHPGDRLKEMLLDILGFLLYTPTAIASTYLLMVLCDNIALRHNLQYSRNFTSHFLAFMAVFGMATIDFTYSSWLVVMFQRHLDAWKQWYQNNCTLHVVLPPRKLRRRNKRKIKNVAATQID